MDRDIPAHRADARKVKAFIRSFGIHGKTDAIDARALATYGQERHTRVPLWQIPAAKARELSTLVARRQELVDLRTAEKNRLQAPVATGRIKTSCRRLIRLIGQEIVDLEAAIQRLIKADDTLKQTQKILTSVKGVGPVVATTLIATMPELGSLTRRQAASITGLAPHPRKSGKYQGYQRTSGGRPEARKALFMAALVASRYNPELKTFYQRLLDNGKKPIVALAAVMRKIITILNAKIRDMKTQMKMS